jgi:hypothetical protein
MPYMRGRLALLGLLAYQLCTGLFFVNFLYRIATFRLLPYRLFRIEHGSWVEGLMIGIVTLTVLAVPLAIAAWQSRPLDRVARQNLLSHALIVLAVFGIVGTAPDGNWYRVGNDLETDPDRIAVIAAEVYDAGDSRLGNAKSMLDWVSTHIRYQGSNPL